RPIVNTRDEPHADPSKYRRLHIIIGDATMAEPATFVRFGSTSLVLSLIESGLAPRIELADALEALQTVSHDLSLSASLPLTDGSTMPALELPAAYSAACPGHAGVGVVGTSLLEAGGAAARLARERGHRRTPRHGA